MTDEKQLILLSKIGSYEPRYLFLRMLIISIIAFLLIYIVKAVSNVQPLEMKPTLLIYLVAIVAFNTITELNLLIIKLLARSKWRMSIYAQIIAILTVTGISGYFWIEISEIVLGDHNILKYKATQIILIIGWLIVIIHLLLSAISDIAHEWMNNRKELSELKQAKLESDYNSLKDRLNPHFLFNNLSVLKSMIKYNPADAEVFTQNFTNVYRYVLNSHNQKTVSLKEELEFLDSYIALHKERIGEGLQIDININDEFLNKFIPPMTLQLLIENAIKHNTANKLHPLNIEIFSDEDNIIVKNNLNIKESTYSTYTGLQSLIDQYKHIENLDIKIDKTKDYFKVVLPLFRD